MQRIVAGALIAVVLTATATAEDRPVAGGKGGYAHVVVFTMKKDTPASAVDEIIKDCHKMLGKISTVRGVKAGRPAEQATPKFAKKDYDLALLILVDDFDGLKSYLEDPLHVAFVKKYEKHFEMEKLRVFDFTDGK